VLRSSGDKVSLGSSSNLIVRKCFQVGWH